MMKKIYKKSFIMTLAASLLILGACNNILTPPQYRGNGETGTVYIAIDGKNTDARTLAPTVDNFTRYVVSFSGPGTQADVEITGGSSRAVSLVAGDWTITVKAYTGTAGSYNEVGQGSALVNVPAGGSASADITITPISGGQGDLSYSVSIPGVDRAVLSLTNMSTDTPVSDIDLITAGGGPGTLADKLNLASGYYLLKIRLEQGGKYAGRTEVVYIYDGLTTNAGYIFTDNDFVDEVNLDNTVNLTDGVWTDGNMTVSGYEYYWFSVISGVSYTVSWNDRNSGDNTKMDINVSAYYEDDGTLLFNGVDDGYNFPQSFIAPLNGTVIIRVEPRNPGDTGSYAVRFTADISAAPAVTLHFDLSGAKAIAVLDPSDSPARSVNSRSVSIGSSDVLVKVLEDDTLAPIVDFSKLEQYGLKPEVEFIAHSPVEREKGFYTHFNQEIRYWESGTGPGGDWYSNEVNLGRFWHVKENGEVVNILGNEQGVWKSLYCPPEGDPVVFDAAGNMFFIVSESSSGSYTNVIYKYNPASEVCTQLTAAKNNLSYQRILISPNGALIIAQASMWNNNNSAYYLRVIPISNPAGYEDIVYSSSYGMVNSFAISPDSRELYFSGSISRRNEQGQSQTESGLFKVSLENLKNMNPVLLFSGGSNSFPVNGNYVFYEWQTDYRKADGSPDYDKIMEYFYDYAASSNIEFRYNGKTDTEALASLTNAQRGVLLYNISSYSTNTVIEVLKQHWFRKGTDTAVTFGERQQYYYNSDLIEVSAEWDDENWTTIYTYKWKDTFYEGGAVDFGKIMAFIYKAANNVDIEFRYNGKTDTEALEAMTSSDIADMCNSFYSMDDFVTQYCYRKGTDKKVTRIPFDSDWTSIQNLISSRSGLWWADEYRDAEDKPDCDKIMAYLRSRTNSDNIEFRYNAKTDAEALMSLAETDLQKVSDYYDSATGNWVYNSIDNYCFRKGSAVPVSKYRSTFGYFSSFSKLVFMSNGSLWGLNNIYDLGSFFCQILDAVGTRDYYVPDPFFSGDFVIKKIHAEEPYFYYSAAIVSSGGQEMAFSKIFRFQVNSTDTVQDLFSYIPRNPDRIELESWSVGAEYLYFSGSQGTDMLSGKINVNTLEYTELDFGRRIKMVISY
jgi:hypothetical protein